MNVVKHMMIKVTLWYECGVHMIKIALWYECRGTYG